MCVTFRIPSLAALGRPITLPWGCEPPPKAQLKQGVGEDQMMQACATLLVHQPPGRLMMQPDAKYAENTIAAAAAHWVSRRSAKSWPRADDTNHTAV